MRVTPLFGVLPLVLLLASHGAGLAQELAFHGVCDGSGGIALPDGRIATVDDEKAPLIRIFSERGGQPIATVTIPGVSDVGNEPDLEAGASIGGMSLWIGSHARNSDGEDKPERQVLLGLPVAGILSGSVAPGTVRKVTTLRGPLQRWGAVHDLDLKAAFGPPGETHGHLAAEKRGVNIEAMAYHPGRRELMIGFRNPVFDGKALVAPIRNHEAVLAGDPPDFGDPVRLQLGDRGLRDMVWSERHDAMLLIAGPSGDDGSFALYRWGAGQPAPVPWPVALPPDFHPETILAISGTNDLLILSDDGDRTASTDRDECKNEKFEHGACTCKNIRNRDAGRLRDFRGLRMTLAP